MNRLNALYVVGILSVFIFGLLYVLLKKLYLLNNKFKKYIEVDTSRKYACPKCQQEMEIGFVVAGKGISFRPNKAKQIGQMLYFNPLLKNTMNMTMSIKENLAWRCKECNYVLVDHSCLVGK